MNNIICNIIIEYYKYLGYANDGGLSHKLIYITMPHAALY